VNSFLRLTSKRMIASSMLLIGLTAASASASETAWTFGMRSNSFFLRDTDNNSLSGKGAAISIGGGNLRSDWFSYFNVNFLLGPYQQATSKSISRDYQGTGVGAWAGYEIAGKGLRSQYGSLAITAGLVYSDFIGRSVGLSELETEVVKQYDDAAVPVTTSERIRNYVIHITELSAAAGVSLCGLKSPRERGNAPQQLSTRIEGYLLFLGVSAPLRASYVTRYTKEYDDGDTDRIREDGRLRGYTLLAELTTLLGV